MKKILTLFAFTFLTTLSFAAYPVGSKENIDGSALGWSESERIWRPLAVDSIGALQTSAGGEIIATISVDTSNISNSLVASTTQSASTTANILNRIASDSKNLELLNTAVTDDNGKLIQAIGAVKSAVNDKVIPTTDLTTTNGKIDSVVTAIGNIPTTDLTTTNGKIDSVASAVTGKSVVSATDFSEAVENILEAIGSITPGSSAWTSTYVSQLLTNVGNIYSQLYDGTSNNSVGTNAEKIASQLENTSSTVSGETLRKEVEDIRDALKTANGDACEQIFMSTSTPGVGSVVTINPLHARINGRERKFIEIQAPTDDTVFYINPVSTGMTTSNSRRCKGKVMLRLSGYSESGTNKNTIYMIVPETYTDNFIQTEGY